MKLRNKKTGEIGYTAVLRGKAIAVMDENAIQLGSYTSLAELNEEWEDYEEDRIYWYIDVDGEIMTKEIAWFNQAQDDIGNRFETKEEAEKAVEKLKAYKRLKDKGFEFVGCFKDNTINYEFVERPLDYDEAEEAEQDLAFLFGGEE